MVKKPSAPAKRRRWVVPFAWFAEESFWRDVTKSAVSTGLVALTAYLYALGAGYVSTPTGAQTLRGIIMVFILVTMHDTMLRPVLMAVEHI